MKFNFKPHKNRLVGGLADKMKPEDFDAKAVAMGTEVEMEHTNDPNIAREIALDHLAEDPRYYQKLRQIEGKSISDFNDIFKAGPHKYIKREGLPGGYTYEYAEKKPVTTAKPTGWLVPKPGDKVFAVAPGIFGLGVKLEGEVTFGGKTVKITGGPTARKVVSIDSLNWHVKDDPYIEVADRLAAESYDKQAAERKTQQSRFETLHAEAVDNSVKRAVARGEHEVGAADVKVGQVVTTHSPSFESYADLRAGKPIDHDFSKQVLITSISDSGNLFGRPVDDPDTPEGALGNTRITMKPEKIFDAFFKAGPHKYIKREGTPGHYVYTYPDDEPKKPHVSEDETTVEEEPWKGDEPTEVGPVEAAQKPYDPRTGAYATTGYIFGSRAELARMLSDGTLEDNPGLAYKYIKKENLIGEITPESFLVEKDAGTTAAAAWGKYKILSLVAKGPDDNPHHRKAYIEALKWLQTSLSNCKNSADIKDLISEVYDMMTMNGAKKVKLSEVDSAKLKAVMEKNPGLMYADRAELASVLRKEFNLPHNVIPTVSEWHQFTEGVGSTKGFDLHITDPKQALSLINHVGVLGKRFSSLCGLSMTKLDEKSSEYPISLFRPHVSSSDAQYIFKRKMAEIDKDPDAWSKWAELTKESERKVKRVEVQQEEGKVKVKKPNYRTLISQARLGTMGRIGPEIPNNKGVQSAEVKKDFNLHEVEYGLWVSDDERQWHTELAHSALADLADTLGIDKGNVGFNGRLGLSIGSRGRGLDSSAAQYQLDTKVINLTKINGMGTLAHEWGHALDHYLSYLHDPGRALGGATDDKNLADDSKLPIIIRAAIKEVKNAMEVDPSGGSAEELKSAFKARMKEAESAYFNTPYREREKSAKTRLAYNELVKEWYRRNKTGDWLPKTRFYADSVKMGAYWGSTSEMFARCFEGYIQDKLKSLDRKNTYLVSGATFKIPASMTTDNLDIHVYPQEAERTRINTAMERLLGILRESGELQKAFNLVFERSNMNEFDFSDLFKAARLKHKYIKREETSPGKYKYYYREDKKEGVDTKPVEEEKKPAKHTPTIEEDTPILPFVVADSVIDSALLKLTRAGHHEAADVLYEDKSKLSRNLVVTANAHYHVDADFHKKLNAEGDAGRDHLYDWMRGILFEHLRTDYPLVHGYLTDKYKEKTVPVVAEQPKVEKPKKSRGRPKKVVTTVKPAEVDDATVPEGGSQYLKGAQEVKDLINDFNRKVFSHIKNEDVKNYAIKMIKREPDEMDDKKVNAIADEVFDKVDSTDIKNMIFDLEDKKLFQKVNNIKDDDPELEVESNYLDNVHKILVQARKFSEGKYSLANLKDRGEVEFLNDDDLHDFQDYMDYLPEDHPDRKLYDEQYDFTADAQGGGTGRIVPKDTGVIPPTVESLYELPHLKKPGTTKKSYWAVPQYDSESTVEEFMTKHYFNN